MSTNVMGVLLPLQRDLDTLVHDNSMEFKAKQDHISSGDVSTKFKCGRQATAAAV